MTRRSAGRPQVSVIACARNAAGRIASLLAGLAEQAARLDQTVEIIVADSASSDGTPGRVLRTAEECPGAAVRLVRLAEPGKCRALNAAVRQARGGILAFLDDDVIPAPDHLQRLLSAFGRPGGPDLLGGRVLARWRDGPPPAWFTPAVAAFTPAHDLGEGRVAYDPPFSSPVGANLAARRKVLEKIGLFDEALGHVGGRPYGAEECDLAFRAAKAGFRVAYDGGVSVAHPFSKAAWTPWALKRRAFFQGAGMARFFALRGLLWRANPWLQRGLSAGARKGVLSGRNALYFQLKALLYAGYLHEALLS